MTEIWEQIGYCDCGRTWNTHGEAHCAGCHEHFTSDSGFDAHRRNDQCHNPKTLRTPRSKKKVFASTERASGQAWKLATEGEHHFASKARREQQKPSEPLSDSKSPSRSSKPVVRRSA